MLASKSLTDRLAAVLPKGFDFRLHHISTPPTKTTAIYSAPPNTRPDRTYCESHFLTVSINAPSTSSVANKEGSSELFVYAIELLIYSTAFSTTFFVSKADSTGYLHLLNFPSDTSSPIKTISSTFIGYLVEKRQRSGLRSIVSLFARAQDQYLFPRSIENKRKHVLDDRGLVRWWCQVLDPVIVESASSMNKKRNDNWAEVRGYLIVPGSDSTRSYLPTEARTGPESQWRWKIGHPLGEISRHPAGLPPRCLIPRFPDDPKARYLDDLDEELKSQSADGQWASVKSVEQFWDAMAFRQECSAGRMVGFLWVVLTPPDLNEYTSINAVHAESQNSDSQTTVAQDFFPSVFDSSFREPPSSPGTSVMPSSQIFPASSPLKHSVDNCPSSSQLSSVSTLRQQSPLSKRKKLRGIIVPRQPKVKTKNSLRLPEFPASTAYYSCPPEGRGDVILAEKDYKRVTELLLRLDFADETLASQSTSRWINEVQSGIASKDEFWGLLITGTREAEKKTTGFSAGVNNLNMGLVRKKRKQDSQDASVASSSTTTASATPTINILGSSMVRKKPKV